MPPRPSVLVPGRRALLVVLLVLVVAWPRWPVAAQGEDADTASSVSVWRVVPEDRVVEVEVVRDGRNELDEAIAGVFETLPATAVDVQATAGGRTLDMLPVADRGDFVEWLVALGRTVEPDGPVAWTLRYRIPSDPPDALVHAYVDDAAVWVSAYAVGDTGAARLRVELPRRYDVGLRPEYGALSLDGTTRVVEPPDDLEPYLPMLVVGEDADARATVPAVEPVPGVVVSPLPGDAAWGEANADATVAALAGLTEVFGTDLPVEEIMVEEVLAGAVDHDDSVEWSATSGSGVVRVEAGAPDGELAHQLSHLWLLDAAIEEPWFEEGLSSAMAERAAGIEPTMVGPTRPTRAELADGPPLLVWPVASADARAASHVVVGEVLDEIGVDAMLEAVATLTAGTITYRGVPPPEAQPTAPDWRVVLDALTEIGGSEDAVDLMSDLVLGDGERASLGSWRAARSTWERLVDRAGNWTLPPALRVPMSAWDFAAVADVAGDVDAVLALRDEVDTLLDQTDLGVPAATRTAFETADAAALADLRVTLEAQVLHAEQVVAAVEAERIDHGLLADLGLWDDDPHGELEAVRERWATGDTAGAAEQAAELVDLVDGAAGRGTIRLLVPVVGIGVMVAIVVAWRRRARPSAEGELSPE